MPSFVVNAAEYIGSEMEYLPQGWDVNRGIKGWNEQSVADAQEKHWPTLVHNLQGSGPLGVSHLPWRKGREDRDTHNVMMSYGYVLARVAGNRQRLSMLDWGGGAGHYCLYNKVLLPEVAIEYHCYDVPSLCQLGRQLVPEARYHDDEKDLLGNRFDLVVSSSSLHYFEHWRAVIRSLAAMTGEFLYVARLQTVSRAGSFVVLHSPLRDGYTQFLSWCLNREEFITCVESLGLELMREFVFTEKWRIRGAPERAETRGFLFRQRALRGDEL